MPKTQHHAQSVARLAGGALWLAPWLLALVAHGASQIDSQLPDYYLPGVPLPVALAVTPEAAVTVYAVEDGVPAGWSVANVSSGGVFDARNAKVKWGPFFDALPRALSYQATPPAGAEGLASFVGQGVFNGQSVPVAGQRQSARMSGGAARQLPAFYVPAMPLDVEITVAPVAGVTLYAVEEQVPPNWLVSGVNQGGVFDARNGKVKWGPFFDAAPRTVSYQITPPASARAPVHFAGRAVFNNTTCAVVGADALSVQPSTAVRVLPTDCQPGVALTVTLNATPAPYVRVYSLEDVVPRGWFVGEVGSGGTFDAANGKAKWGPFFDTVPRTLSYRVTPPASAAGRAVFAGQGVFDETAALVTGASALDLHASHAESALVRILPETCQAQQSFTAQIAVTPADSVKVYAVEDHLPQGWTLSAVSHGGAFDAANGKVKWGPFFDATERVLTCEVTPPADCTGAVTFTGWGAFNGAVQPVTGQQTLALQPCSVTRSLPPSFSPGVPLSVSLEVKPSAGVRVYAVEDDVPTGWTAGDVSDGGGFDALTRKIKWAPIYEHAPRTLSYQLVPPANAAGTVTFAGRASFDGLLVDITGQQQVVGNHPPVLTVPGDQTLNELDTLMVVATATDADLPADTLTFELLSGPAGMSVNPTTGLVLWTPTEAQGPSASIVTVCVHDGGGLTDTKTFAVTVSEVNTAPVLAAAPDQTVKEGALLSLAMTAADADLPANTLSFSLMPGAPAGASINPATGEFAWTPSQVQAPSTNQVTVRVTDDGLPNLSSEQTFTIVVVAGNTVICSMPEQFEPGISFGVTNRATPRARVRFYMVVDRVPKDWEASEISHNGSYDPRSRWVRWGPFRDDAIRDLTYRVTPPPDAQGTYTFEGQARFDWTTVPITGQRETTAIEANRIVRSLPTVLRAGASAWVSDQVTVASSVSVYAVEDQVPAGWSVSAINCRGVFDPARHIVRWGPFADGVSRTLIYRVTAPSNAAGPASFSGTGVFDGVTVAITGDQTLTVLPNHWPVARDDFFERWRHRALVIPVAQLLANDTDPDGDALTLTSVPSSSAHGARLILAGPMLVYLPPPSFNGPDSFGYTISDGFGGTATATVNVTVRPGNPAGRLCSVTGEAAAIALGPEGAVHLRFTGRPGLVYLVQATEGLTGGEWITLTAFAGDQEGAFEFEDRQAPDYPIRFYRALALPAP